MLCNLYKITLRCYSLAAFSLLFSAPAISEEPLSKEQKLKAAYLLNFTKFIEWPILSEDESIPTINICVAATPKCSQFLSQLVSDRRVGRLQSKVSVIPYLNASNCKLLYIQGKQKFNLAQSKNTVIVADVDNSLSTETAIMFYTENRKLRFEINLEKIKQLQVKVSSELLKLARIKR